MLSLRGVRKSYAGVEVLHGVDLEAHGGEVLAIVGANGAGKSTLIKILCGAVKRDGGEIEVAGRREPLGNPHAAQALGIRTVHQELSLVPDLSVTENVLLGDLPTAKGLVDWAAAHARARALLGRTGFSGIDVRTHARRLSVARQQMVEIAKAMASEPKILILDEPSAVLAGDDLDQLFALIRALRADGVLVVYVSHRLEEVMAIADRVTVMRDGMITATTTPGETSESELVRLMAGRGLDQIYPRRRTAPGAELLSTHGLCRDGVFSEVDLAVHAGEVVGMFGLVGSGRSEVAEVLFGAAPRTSGVIVLGGKPMRLRSPKEAIDAGIALVTEDRKSTGLVLDLSVRDNVSLATMRTFRRRGLIDRARQARSVADMTAQLDVRPPGIDRPVKHLSGGNQQKVVLSKWLLSKPKVLILDEPTRGVDVAARVDLYRMVDELTRAGLGVLMISSDLTEVLGMSDRVLVMHEGRIAADLRAQDTNEEEVLAYSIGVSGVTA
jgi:ABC-type sugar transport system ATPase subunit